MANAKRQGTITAVEAPKVVGDGNTTTQKTMFGLINFDFAKDLGLDFAKYALLEHPARRAIYGFASVTGIPALAWLWKRKKRKPLSGLQIPLAKP